MNHQLRTNTREPIHRKIKMKRTLYTLILLLTVLASAAQTFSLSGRVSDDNGDALEMATITVMPQMKVAFTNLKGEFSLQAQTADSVVVRFSMVGFKTKTRVLRRPKGKMQLQVRLFSDNTLSEVTVTERRRQTSATEQISFTVMYSKSFFSSKAIKALSIFTAVLKYLLWFLFIRQPPVLIYLFRSSLISRAS